MSQDHPRVRLSLYDTPLRYGLVTRFLHWSIAVLMLWQFAGMTLKLVLGRVPVAAFFVGTHQKVGLILFGLIVLRLIWAGLNRHRRPDHGGGMRGLAARLGHLALYVLMIVVPGVALLRAKQAVGTIKGDNADQDAGIKLILKAIEAPLREIVNNAGGEASVVVNEVLNGKGNYGFNASNDTYGDMLEMGILDPTKVTRTALQNAASVASLLLTTECMVAEAPKDEAAAPAMPDMGGMGGMGM